MEKSHPSIHEGSVQPLRMSLSDETPSGVPAHFDRQRAEHLAESLRPPWGDAPALQASQLPERANRKPRLLPKEPLEEEQDRLVILRAVSIEDKAVEPKGAACDEQAPLPSEAKKPPEGSRTVRAPGLASAPRRARALLPSLLILSTILGGATLLWTQGSAQKHLTALGGFWRPNEASQRQQGQAPPRSEHPTRDDPSAPLRAFASAVPDDKAMERGAASPTDPRDVPLERSAGLQRPREAAPQRTASPAPSAAAPAQNDDTGPGHATPEAAADDKVDEPTVRPPAADIIREAPF